MLFRSVDWCFGQGITPPQADKLHSEFHDKVFKLECNENEIEECLKLLIEDKCGYQVDEVEYTYR